MTDHMSEDEVLAAVPGLTRTRLIALLETEVIIPLRRTEGTVTAQVFSRIDIFRMRLLCELADDLELDEAALGVVVTLLDQLHAARQDLLVLARALQSETPDVRARVGAALLGSLV